MDRRDRIAQHGTWYTDFDERRMVFVIEGDTEQEDLCLPAKWSVCQTCEGSGSHVNASIDSHGLTHEDFAEDPDFYESYSRGDYDVTCVECLGRRVVPETDDPRADELKESHWDSIRTYEAERRMGA